VLEGAASGLPVIGTRHGGIKDSIVDEETGFLVDEYDTSAMAEQMEMLCSDGQMASVMGRKGRARMEEVYRMEESIEGLHEVLLDACRSRRGG
jgi:glycosyltransferase involved in cell wall biosynthesis